MLSFLRRKIKKIFSPTVKIKGVEYFHFRYTCGYFCDADQSYELCKAGDGFTAYVKPIGKPREERRKYAVNADFALKLEALLANNGVGKWNGFDKSNKMVLDGDSFALKLTNESGEKLSANGYMRWPKNYLAVKEGLEELFGTLDKGE
ncbi:MAG: hypothetical protein IJB76_02370 [Clostridia bacterium]|nr:hypothetical protein [Clostridia bacterium]